MSKLSVVILLGITVFSAASSRAGPWIAPEELVRTSNAIACVSVDLNSESVTISEWLSVAEPPPEDPRQWFGLCLPDRTLIRKWTETHPHHPSKEVWAQAVEQGRYESIIFLKKKDMHLAPNCEAESMLATQWTIHPDHAAYRERILQSLDAIQINSARPCTSVSTMRVAPRFIQSTVAPLCPISVSRIGDRTDDRP